MDAEYVAKYGPGPHDTVDAVIFVGAAFDEQERDYVILVERYDGSLALPGGFIDKGETPIQAAYREFEEETLIPKIDIILNEAGFIMDDKDRDPRAWIRSTPFYGPLLEPNLATHDQLLELKKQLEEYKFAPNHEVRKLHLVPVLEATKMNLRVDHAKIIWECYKIWVGMND